MAGYRCPDYFPEYGNHTEINRVKYKRYFCYLGAKGFSCSETVKPDKYATTRICTETCTRKTPFHAGSDLPNSRRQSGSFRPDSHEPALVRKTSTAINVNFTVSGCLIDLRDLLQGTYFWLKQVNNGKGGK